MTTPRPSEYAQNSHAFIFQNFPLTILKHQDQVAFLADEIAKVLEIESIAQVLERTKKLQAGIDYDIEPETAQKNLRVLYPSGVIILAMRSTQPIGLELTRWLVTFLPSMVKAFEAFPPDATLQ